MGNIVNLIITVGLQKDLEGGEVAFLLLPLPEKVAEVLIEEQENSPFVYDGGSLAEMLNAYAILCGYQCGWFVRAESLEEATEAVENGGEA